MNVTEPSPGNPLAISKVFMIWLLPFRNRSTIDTLLANIEGARFLVPLAQSKRPPIDHGFQALLGNGGSHLKLEVAVFIKSHHGKHLKLDMQKWVDFEEKQSWDSQLARWGCWD